MSAKKKVFVAMSGGVDSSVTALLLKNEGYEVAGGHMRLRYDSDFDRRKSDLNVEYVEKTTALLNIPFHLITLEDPFQVNVIEPFLKEYESGITPNPCIYCNIKIKFGKLYEAAKNLGYDYIATGHYTKVDTLPNGRRAIVSIPGVVKDQSYYLYGLSQDVLEHAIFPLAGFDKADVRKIAAENGLPAAERAESQEICFVDGDYRDFLKDEGVDFHPGEIVDTKGNVLGRHDGTENFTIGQRRGLNVAVGHPLYVVAIDGSKGQVVVGEKEELDRTEFLATDMRFQGLSEDELSDEGVEVLAQIRYNSKPIEATIYSHPEGVRVVSHQAAFAITPGQAAVFYHPDKRYIMGGGKIRYL